MNSSRNDSPRGFVDRFRVESRLGRGGMGDVYKAYDTVLQRTVAVKTLTPGNADAQAVQRLLREARACARLTHPGIVTIHDALESEGSVYIVMEHLPGASLELLHKFPRLSSFEAKIGIVVRILEALHYAHGRGVVHRDVKPRNVQILPDGSVKLLDFGVAHVAGVAALTGRGESPPSRDRHGRSRAVNWPEWQWARPGTAVPNNRCGWRRRTCRRAADTRSTSV